MEVEFEFEFELERIAIIIMSGMFRRKRLNKPDRSANTTELD